MLFITGIILHSFCTYLYFGMLLFPKTYCCTYMFFIVFFGVLHIGIFSLLLLINQLLSALLYCSIVFYSTYLNVIDHTITPIHSFYSLFRSMYC